MTVESREVVEAAADLIKANSRPSAALINKANLISCCKIRFAAIASDFRSDVLDLLLVQRAPRHCWIAAMAQSALLAARALSKSSGALHLSSPQLQLTRSDMPAFPASSSLGGAFF